jgi:hypothetical protein
MIRFCAELYAITYELQALLKYISILLLGWCHYLITDNFVMEPTTVSTINFTNASFDDGVYAVASHDITSRSRVVVRLKAMGVPNCGFHGNASKLVTYHTFEELEVDNNNATTTSTKNLIADIVASMDTKTTSNMMTTVVAHSCSCQEKARCCANTNTTCNSLFLEGKHHYRSYRHLDMDDMPFLMMLMGNDKASSMRILVHLRGEPLTALIDSGATHNVIGVDVLNRFDLHISRPRVHVIVANVTSMESKDICRNIRLSKKGQHDARSSRLCKV